MAMHHQAHSASQHTPHSTKRHKGCAGAMPHYQTRLAHLPELSEAEQESLHPVVERFAFRANEYYSSLINWDDPEDPIRRIIIPEVSELTSSGAGETEDEARHIVAPGLEHAYGDMAVLLVNGACGGFCRFCFRKRMFAQGHHEAAPDMTAALAYLREHEEISTVVLSGGDPLLLSTEKLGRMLHPLRLIRHVRNVRIESKMPAFNPYRILQDPELLDLLRECGSDEQKITLMAHFNHPRELTEEAMIALSMVQEAGVTVLNQTPLLKGINSDPAALAELMNRLAAIGVEQHAIYQCRPTEGAGHFVMPLEQAYKIFEKARVKCGGAAKRARFVMAHQTGKIEVIGRTREQIFMRHHRAADFQDKGVFLMFESNPEACWLDEYIEKAADGIEAGLGVQLTA